MARSSIQDQPPKTRAGSFERQPPQDLEDTQPFSLLNALLEGVDGAVTYEPPSLEAELPLIVEDEVGPSESGIAEKGTISEPSEAPDAPRVAETKTEQSPSETIEELASELEKPAANESIKKAVAAKEIEASQEEINVVESSAKEVTSTSAEADELKVEEDDSPKPLPKSFLKISAELPPPPPPPRPKRRQFSTNTPSFRKLGEHEVASPSEPEPKPEIDVAEAKRGAWPRRGFHGAATPKRPSLDPINKALRIFETLENEEAPKDKSSESLAKEESEKPDVSPPEEKTLEVPAPEDEEEVQETSDLAEPVPVDIAELDTVKIQLPKTRPKTAKPEPPSPKPMVPVEAEAPKEEEAKTEVPQDRARVEPAPQELRIEPTPKPLVESSSSPAPESKESRTSKVVTSKLPPVPVRRRRRRRVPVNPWTAKPSDAVLAGRQDRRQHIDKTLQSLATMLEATLQTPTEVKVPLPKPTPDSEASEKPNSPEPKSEPVAEKPNSPEPKSEPVAEKPNSPEPKSDPVVVNAEEAPTKKVTLRQSFTEDPHTRRTAKVKLVPRALRQGDSTPAELSPTSHPEFEITAPTTLVAQDAPISPFTKVARGQTSEVKLPDNQQTTESPFMLAGTPVVVPQVPPTAASVPDKKVFASPFSTALKKRQETSGEGVSAKVAISPPETSIDQEKALAEGQLPAPTYSFATMGMPSSQAKVPSVAPPAKAEVTTPVPIRSSEQPTAPPSPFGPLSTQDKKSDSEGLVKDETKTAANGRPRPEPSPWGLYTWILCIVCGVFFLIYLYEIIQQLSGPTEPKIIRPDAEDILPDDSVLQPLVPEETIEDASLTPPLDGTVPLVASVEAGYGAPMECMASFLKANNPADRDRSLINEEIPAERLAKHYRDFPMQAGGPRQVMESGDFADSERSYMVVRMEWADKTESDVTLIKDERGHFRFSWYAFEQSRNKLLRHYAETAWTEWTQFFIQIRPIDPETLPASAILENLYYRITVPEDPQFEAIGYVDSLSSMAEVFKERFSNPSTYQVYADLLRGERFPDDERPLFRITRLLQESWDPTP